MYQNASLGAGAAGGALALSGNAVWVVLAAFALIAVGAALWRMVPRKER